MNVPESFLWRGIWDVHVCTARPRSANDRERAGEEQGHSATRSRLIGVSSSPRMPIRSMITDAVSCPVIVAAATPPAPIELTVTRAVNT